MQRAARAVEKGEKRDATDEKRKELKMKSEKPESRGGMLRS